MTVRYQACSVEGCNGNAHYTARGTKGLCRPHTRRRIKYGDPLKGRTLNGTAKKFFREVVIPCQVDECLIWPFGTRSGYGVISTKKGPIAVHRLACIEVNGPPPTPDHESAHYCGNGKYGCVNPKHVRWATSSENQMDRVVHGSSNRGERCGSAKLTRQQVIEIRAQTGLKTQTALGLEYGVHRITIAHIQKRKNWYWLD